MAEADRLSKLTIVQPHRLGCLSSARGTIDDSAMSGWRGKVVWPTRSLVPSATSRCIGKCQVPLYPTTNYCSSTLTFSKRNCRDRAALISRTLSAGLLKPFCKGLECFFRNNKKRTIGNVVPGPGNLQDGVKKDATSEKFSRDLAEGISISCRATDFEQIKDRDLAGKPVLYSLRRSGFSEKRSQRQSTGGWPAHCNVSRQRTPPVMECNSTGRRPARMACTRSTNELSGNAVPWGIRYSPQHLSCKRPARQTL